MNALAPAPVRIIASPKVFGGERITGAVPAGQTIDEMIGALVAQCGIHPLMIPALAVFVVDPDTGREARVPYDRWRFTRPRAGKLLLVKAMPQGGGGGGGGKSPIKMVALLAVMVIAWYAAPLIAGAVLGEALAATTAFTVFGASVTYGAIVGGIASLAINLVGSALINALIPTNSAANRGDLGSSFTSSPISAPAYALTGTRNRSNPYGSIPKIYGRRRVYPLMGARTYSEVSGSDQYLRAIFCFGYGPLQIEDLSIGNTPITAFTDLEYELRYGYDDDEPTTLFSNSVREDALNVALTSAGGWVQRTSYSNANELSVDLSFPRGLTKFETSGGRSSLTVTVELEYRAVGDPDWIVEHTFTVTDNATAAVRTDYRWAVAEDQYEIRMRRTTADQTESQYVDATYWTAIRTITTDHPINMVGLALLAVRIKASEQLNGPLDTVNALCTSVLPTWNGTSWDTPSPQRNPAWAFCDVLRGPANKRPIADSFIDLAAIKEWADACDAASPQGDAPSWTYDAVHDSRSTVEATLREIAATSRARYVQAEGKYSVVRDVAQATPWQHFTPRNSSGFKATRNFIEHPHALRCRFVNPDRDWQEDEVLVYSDGYSSANATVFEQLDMLACTRSEQAWREGRYHMAAAKLRPATYELSTDVEHLVCKAGDLVKVAWDVPIWGAGTGRITSVTLDGTDITEVTVDESFAMEEGQSYNIRVRKSDNTSILLPITTAVGAQTTLALVTPISVASGPEVGDVVMFGRTGQEAVDLLVKEIQRGDELTARLVLVDAAPTVHDWYSGTLPVFTSQISAVADVERQQPPTPSIVEVWDDEVLDKGTVVSRTYIRLSVSPSALVPAARVEAWYRTPESSTWLVSARYSVGESIELWDLAGGQAYEIRVRSISEYGITSDWATTTYTSIGLATVPEDVSNFRIAVLGTTAYLSWDAVGDVDLSHYVLKWSPVLTGATWGSAQILLPKITGESVSTPAMQGTYLIKAVDYSVSESANATLVTNAISEVLGLNAVATITESPTFVGAKTDTVVIDGALQLVSLLTLDDIADVDAVLNFDVLGDAFVAEGTYDFADDLDLGAEFTSRLTAEVLASGTNYASNLDTWTDIDAVDNWEGSDPSGWVVDLQVRTTSDDPSGAPVWSAWRPFIVGDYAARAFQWRVILQSLISGTTPSITTLSVSVDMPDRLASANDQACPTDGVTISFAPPFHATPAIAVADQDMATGDYKVLSSMTASGFSVRYYNASGTPVARTFDWVARGYGYAN